MKNPILVVSLVFLLCLAFSCQNKAEKAELEKFRAQAALEEQNKSLVKRAYEAWNKGDLDAFKDMLSPQSTRYYPSRINDIRSMDEFLEYWKAVHISTPDITCSIEESYAEGDTVTIRITLRGTHQGEWLGIPASGNKVESSGIEIWRIENEKVVEVRTEYDALGLLQQMGMELKPKEVKK